MLRRIASLIKAYEIFYEVRGSDSTGVNQSWVCNEALKVGVNELERNLFGEHAKVPDPDDTKAWAEFRKAAVLAISKSR